MSLKNEDGEPQEFWDRRRGVIFSRTGGADFRTGRVLSHGYSIMDDLVGNITYTQMIALNATGRVPERRVADWIEAAFICLSWPDARIWCNQIGALCGTLRTSAVAGTAAGMLAADSTTYGTLPLVEGVKFIQFARTEQKAGRSAADIVDKECTRFHGKPHIVGYARPIARGDERVAALERVSEQLEFNVGEHLALAYEIQNALLDRFGETMNINGYTSAFLSDLGYTAEEVYQMAAMSVNSGVTACFLDAAAQPAEAFLPMACDDVEYTGKDPRRVPQRGR